MPTQISYGQFRINSYANHNFSYFSADWRCGL